MVKLIDKLFFNEFRELINIVRLSVFIFMTLVDLKSKQTIEILILILLFFSIILSLRFTPRMTRILNILENFSLIACFFTISHIFSFDQNSPDLLKKIFLFIVLLSHCLFLVGFAYEIFKNFLFKYPKKLKKRFKNFNKMFSSVMKATKRVLSFKMKQANFNNQISEFK